MTVQIVSNKILKFFFLITVLYDTIIVSSTHI
jgi:hypothetical protein